MGANLKFCIIFWLIYELEGQSARCDYKQDYYWSKGYTTTNTSYYKCILDTRQANYDEKLTKIDGKHLTGHTDADVKYIINYTNSKLKIFSSIFCQNFPNLEAMQTNHAELESVDDDSLLNCKNLKYLLIAENKYRELPEYLLIRNPQLTYLRLNNNQLTTFPKNFFINQKQLKDLGIDGNQIDFLPSSIFHSLEKLEALYLFNNKLQSLNPDWLTTLQNLQDLRLDGNQILEIPSKCFAKLRNLKTLRLNDNRIKTLNSDSFDGLQNLQILSLHSNEISDLPIGAFAVLGNLQKFDIRDNKLSTIYSDSFGIHNQLRVVWFQNNKINAIDPKIIDNTAVSTLNLINNICCQLLLTSRSEMNLMMKNCFDNYRNKPMQLGSCEPGAKVYGTIIGGSQVTRKMFPWKAALMGPDDKYFCGGTLISKRKVVTAAHCMVFLEREITVILGVHNLSKPREVGSFPYAVQAIHIHPDWNQHTDRYDADIAVMVLETDVTFSEYIQPVCLIYPYSNLASMSEGIVVGYGKDEGPEMSNLNIPKYLKMPIYENEDCYHKNHQLAQYSSKRTFCGGDGNGTGVCKGDSGSGFVVTDGRVYYLRGIVSASLINMTYGCDVDTYSIFTNVLHFTEWINQVSVLPIH